MNVPLEVVLVCASPIYSTAVQCWLGSEPKAVRCRSLEELEERAWEIPAAHELSPVLLIAPQHWRELAGWLPCLRKQFAAYPWLILADLRLPGMFWPCLEAQLCSLVAPGASPDRLRVSLWVLAERQALCPLHSLLHFFSHGAPLMANGGRVALTRKELQCGCGVSLGLSNRHIADALHLGEGTVKGHVHHLMRKLDVPDREELGARFERIFAPLPWAEPASAPKGSKPANGAGIPPGERALALSSLPFR